MDDKYLNYEGLKKFKLLLENIRISDKLELVTTLNELSGDIGDGTLTIKRNNVVLGNFSANLKNNNEININVPTSISDLEAAINEILNLINYGQIDVSDLTEELKKALHNRNASDNGFISKDVLDTQLTVFGKIINYDSARLMIQLKNEDKVLSEFSATEFLKDGMVSDVKITLGTGTNVGKSVLLIDFNTESGIDDIEIPLELIFNAKNYYTKDLVDSIVSSITGESGTVITDLTINDSIDNYIENSGKQLSTNDFTNSLKDKLNGIAAGAELNVQSDWNVTDTNSDAFIKNKPTIPSNYSQLVYTRNAITGNIITEGGSLTLDGTNAIIKISTSGNISGISLSTLPENNHSCHLIVKNTATDNISLVMNGDTTYICPEGEINITIAAGSYGELDLLNLDGEIFVRGI